MEINKIIANYCEKVSPSEDERKWHWKCPTGDYVPNLFTTDLNAMHEALMLIKAEDYWTYGDNLWSIATQNNPGEARFIEQPAWAKAEAFVKTMNLISTSTK